MLAEGQLGRDRYQVRGTPTHLPGDGTKLRHPMTYPKIQDGRIVSLGRLPCCGTGCDDAIRALFERALRFEPLPDAEEG